MSSLISRILVEFGRKEMIVLLAPCHADRRLSHQIQIKMDSFTEVLKSIAITLPYPILPTTLELESATADQLNEHQEALEAFRKAHCSAKRIRIFTASREYFGVITKVADDYFVIDDKEHPDLRVMISRVECFDFPAMLGE